MMSTKAVLQPHNANTSTDRPTIKGNSPSTPAMPPTPVRVSYAALQAACDDPSDPSAACLAGQLLAAYGPDGLGLILVDGVPDLAARRAALLPLASSLAQLPDATRAQLEDPQSSYNIGWSHGKETLANGVPDLLKASFYANPMLDVPTTDPALIAQHPSYCRPNVWPRQALPELEVAFKALGSLMVQVGAHLARHMDALVQRETGVEGGGRLESVVRLSPAHKARLLHYFPSVDCPVLSAAQADEEPSGEAPDEGTGEEDTTSRSKADLAVAAGEQDEEYAAWCGWHLDHGSLTGLTSAMYLTPRGEQLCTEAATTATASGRAVGHGGLYVRTRRGDVVHVSIPADCLAFQLGECAQVASGGLLRATPHCVRAAADSSLARNTFAVFMQPRWDAAMAPPPGRTEKEVDVVGWQPSHTFGDFTALRLREYYQF